jgi:hypothetical protein
MESGRVETGRLVPDEQQIEHFQNLVKAALTL